MSVSVRLRVMGQRGASLIEVLVAILIVSLGVVSMAGLLATATRLGKASEIRSVAALMAADIGDRMKANAAGIVALNYDLINEFAVPAPAPAANVPACAVVTACTPAELAAIDLAEWQRALYFGLPNGMGYVQYDAVGKAMDVWVAWLDPSALSNADFDAIETLDSASGRERCPPGFRAGDPKPRCIYVRVGLQ